MISEKKKIYIYTDGACKGNPGRGGWGALLRFNDHEKEMMGYEEHTTNNRMELMAAIRALQTLKQSCSVDIYTDSQYVMKGITEWLPKWKKNAWRTSTNKPIKNEDLWMELDQVASLHGVNWFWVRGHDGHPENERADFLANQAIIQQMKGKSP